MEERLQKFEPNIAKYVRELLRDGDIGVCGGNLEIKDVNTGRCASVRQPCCDRFKLCIPYAGHHLIWEIIFNSSYPEYPPDFIFISEEEFNPQLDSIKSLVEWNFEDESALIHVLRELLHAFKQYQITLLERDHRLQYEYSSLSEEAEESDIEIYVKQIGFWETSVDYLIQMGVNLSDIPPYLTMENSNTVGPDADMAVLLVKFEGRGSEGHFLPHLYLSPRVEYAFSNAKLTFNLPPFPGSSCIIDYIPRVKLLLTEKIEQINNSFNKRKEYVTTFLSHYGKSALEFDFESYNGISLLLSWQGFFFILHVKLTSKFPDLRPTFIYQSVYHVTSDGQPYRQEDSHRYPYSPRWPPQEMVTRARVFMEEKYMAEFKAASAKAGKLF